MADQTQNYLQVPTFYKPDPNNPQVYDAQGKAIDLATYKIATGQQNVPDNQLNWQYVQNAQVPATSSTAQFDPSTIGIDPNTWQQLDPSAKATLQAAGQIYIGQQKAGTPIPAVDANLMTQALQLAQSDPNILATYGDAAKLAANNLQFQLQQITGNNATSQPALQASQLQQKQALDAQIATAGQAYSGFRKQAEQQLSTQQADVIQSTRSQLQQQIQQLGQGYEQAYGSGFPGTAGSSSITANGPVTGQVTYQPVGGLTGTVPIQQKQDVQNTANQYYQAQQLK